MATFQIRHLHCVNCDEKVRARVEVIDGVEQQAFCPDCNSALLAIGSLDMPALKPVHDHVIKFEPGSIVINANFDEERLAWILAEEIQRRRREGDWP